MSGYNVNKMPFGGYMVGRTDINSVLMQMRELQIEAQQGIKAMQSAEVVQPRTVQPASNDFTTLLRSAIDSVNQTQQAAGQLADRYQLGDPTVDLPEVMINLQRASIAFQAMSEVRNRFVQAYQDVANMAI